MTLLKKTPENSCIADLPRTKLVATLGPASNSAEMIKTLIVSGVDVFRLNMAHASIEIHQTEVDTIRQISASLNQPVGILVDLAGPKIRLGQLFEDPIHLEMDQSVTFIRGREPRNRLELTCGYPRLLDELGVGDDMVLADGMARLVVVERGADSAVCRVSESGTIRSRQGINLPATKLSLSALGEIDREHAAWAAKVGADFVSLSFVRNADEVRELKGIFDAANSPARVIAKIEKREALDHLDDIIAAADGVMVARGDLGVEIDIEKTPVAQKRIIKSCLQLGKPVIVATQMLESMHHSKQPTRAEVSDVANAILDGADACMLSGETAIGEYPVESVRMMKKIMKETEKMLRYRSSRLAAHENDTGWTVTEAVMLGAAQIARRMDAKLVVIVSSHSNTALIKSKQRDFVTTVCLTDEKPAAQRMCMYWGIVPIIVATKFNQETFPQFVSAWAREKVGLQSGDRIIMIMDNEVLPGIHDTIAVAEIH